MFKFLFSYDLKNFVSRRNLFCEPIKSQDIKAYLAMNEFISAIIKKKRN